MVKDWFGQNFNIALTSFKPFFFLYIFLYFEFLFCLFVFSLEEGSGFSDDNEGKIRHLVLCRVILGKSELVRRGSEQRCPSSDEFDSGVDDLSRPRKYIIWSTHMNTCVLPEYVISFRAPFLRGNHLFMVFRSDTKRAHRTSILLQNVSERTRMRGANARPIRKWLFYWK